MGLSDAEAGNVVTPSVINKAYGIDQRTVKKSGKPNIQAIGQFQGQYVSTQDLSKFCQAYDAKADCSISKFIGKNTATRPGVESMLDTEYITGVADSVSTWVYSYPGFDFCSDLLTWAGDVAGESQHPYVVSLSHGSQKIDFCDGATRTRLSEDVQKLGAMGVTVVIASGDDGSGGMSRQGSNSGKLSPSFPASIPTALAVGATFFESGLSGEEMATTQFGSGGDSPMIMRHHPIRLMLLKRIWQRTPRLETANMLRTVVVLQMSPCWASSSKCTQVAILAAFRRFLLEAPLHLRPPGAPSSRS